MKTKLLFGRIKQASIKQATLLLPFLVLTSATSAVERQLLHGHVPEAVARLNLQPLGRLPSTNRLNLVIGLPLRNPAELARLLQELYDPASPQFRHYLTPETFTQRFGPTAEDYQALIAFANTHGLEVTATQPNRMFVEVCDSRMHIE